MNIIKNPLRTFLGLNRRKNKNIKAWRKKGSSYKKKKVYRRVVINAVNQHFAVKTKVLEIFFQFLDVFFLRMYVWSSIGLSVISD